MFSIAITGWRLSPTPLKNMSSSLAMMTFPTEWKVIKAMFQTTNQNKIQKVHNIHLGEL